VLYTCSCLDPDCDICNPAKRDDCGPPCCNEDQDCSKDSKKDGCCGGCCERSADINDVSQIRVNMEYYIGRVNEDALRKLPKDMPFRLVPNKVEK